MPGEHGLFGNEESTSIAPAVKLARAAGIKASDPLPADTLFGKAARGDYDGVVAMYHDQGLIPLKLVAFGTCVNLTVAAMPETLLQRRLQLWIDLDSNNTARFGTQTGSQGASPRPDFQHGILRAKRRQGHDLADNVRIDEEVLTEPFQGWGERGGHTLPQLSSRLATQAACGGFQERLWFCWCSHC